MKAMKKKRVMVAGLSVACALLCACGGFTGNDGSDTGEKETDAAENGRTAGEDAGAESQNAAENGARSLTEAELQAFTDYINEGDNRGNYGFLLSVYDTPADIDLNEVFFSGAGIGGERALSEEEEQAYLAATGQEEVYTAVVWIEAEKIDAFLQEKTGLTYEEMNYPLEWTYLEEYDIYCEEHGDTNYQTFTCMAGSTSDEQRFTLRFSGPEIWLGGEIETGYRQPDYELVVEKYGDGYRFLSNRLITEEGQIAEQTFPVTVEEYGEVTFASYEPDYDLNPQADVTFMLLSKEGEIIQTLSGVTEDNIRAAAESFENVAAVSFPDYNEDGYTDIITIANYSYIQGPDAGGGFAEVRIYSGSESGYFYYEEDVSDIINAEMEEPTVQKVREFLSGINYYGIWEVTDCAGTTPVYALSEEEIAERVGATVVYAANFYAWNGEELWIPGYVTAQKTADTFREEFGVSLSELGVQADSIIEVTVDYEHMFGDHFFVVDHDTILLYQDGVFFSAKRAE